MSFSTPAHTITRWSVVHMEGMWVKMFDPPKESPVTPDMVPATNPVPEVLAAAGFQRSPDTPHTVVLELMHGERHDTWDDRDNGMEWFLFFNPDSNGITGDEYPSATLRLPQGVVFHCETDGKGPPPHTIHWHGHEPTPMNDGVGHCSMEIGHYVYQLQPQFIGTYFAHCHRNTMQHFEFGLFFLMLVEPKDAYFATLHNPAIPIGHCRDGRRRTAANLSAFPAFPDFNNKPITALDGWKGNPNLKFDTDPHAHTVAYDVEALWVLDDRDSTWSDLADNPRATYPRHGTRPGFNDNFHNNADLAAAPTDFFAFNDFHADYWYVTGVPVQAHKGGSATLPAGIEIPATLNSGVAGSQISIKALVGQTILVRCLDAAYNSTEVTFPVDVVIIAWDGRALGVAPFGYNHAYLVPAGTPIKQTTARRFDALIRVDAPVNSFATVKFINTRGQVPGEAQDVLVTARIPMVISASHQIVATAGANGMVTPLGSSAVAPGATKSYSITPNPGYKVASIMVDGVQVALASSYSFTNVTASHTLRVTFTPTNTPTGTIVIEGGAASTAAQKVTVALSASAVAPATVTQMAFAKDNGAFFPFEPFAASRTVTLTPGNGVKTVSVRFKDSLGRVSDPIYDVITLAVPSLNGTIAINGGAPYVRSQYVTLALSASSSAGAVTQMQFSKDGENYFPYEPFAVTRVVTLTAGEGPKTIWVRFKDAQGNVSAPVSANITLDSVKPTGTIAFTSPNPTSASTGALTLTASDATSGVTQMQFSKNGGLTYFPWEPFAAVRNVTLPVAGLNTLTVRFKDAAGNVSDPVSASVTRNA